MGWHYRLIFVAAAALAIWGFISKEVYYPFADVSAETRMPKWLARLDMAILAALFIWLAFRK